MKVLRGLAILLLVPVFGAALAMILVGDRLGVRELIGAALIVLAVIVGEVLPSRRRDVTHL